MYKRALKTLLCPACNEAQDFLSRESQEQIAERLPALWDPEFLESASAEELLSAELGASRPGAALSRFLHTYFPQAAKSAPAPM